MSIATCLLEGCIPLQSSLYMFFTVAQTADPSILLAFNTGILRNSKYEQAE